MAEVNAEYEPNPDVAALLVNSHTARFDSTVELNY